MGTEIYQRIQQSASQVARRYRAYGSFDADDLKQEATIAILGGRRSINGPMQDYARKQLGFGDLRSGCKRASLGEWNARHSPERALMAGIDVRRLLSSVSGIQRQAVEMHYLEGMRESEMVGVLRISTNAVRNRIHEGMKNMRRLATSI